MENADEDAIKGCTLQECVAGEGETDISMGDGAGSANSVETIKGGMAVVNRGELAVG